MHVLPTVEWLEIPEVFKGAKSVGVMTHRVENYSWSSLVHTTCWEQPVEQLLHRGSEENCFGETPYKLVQNKRSELKIKHYLWPQVQFKFTPGSLFNSECNQRQCLQHCFKLHYEEFDPKSAKICISTRMLHTKSSSRYVLFAALTGATGIGRNCCF